MAKKKISKNPLFKIKKRIDSFLNRRPHRSFRITRRRDYSRSLDLPGYWAFTAYVRKTLLENRKTFILLAITYALLTLFMVGIVPQDNYKMALNTLDSSSGDLLAGAWGEIGKASLMFVAAASGSLSTSPSEVQQIYALFIMLLAWLTSVWLLRNILAGRKVKLRDGLYSSGSPILATLIVFMVLLVQMLPLALALIGYGAATATGLLSGGVEAMMFWIVAGLLAILSLYWMTSTFFALVIVTLPGMYPFQAIRAAGDLMVGRRLRILLRLLWMLLGVIIIWALIMIPMIIFDHWMKNTWQAISWLPTVPVILLILSSVTVIWVSSYIYLLYRKVVADESAPA